MGALELTYTDADGARVGVKRAFSLDLACGDEENDFELRLAETDSVPLHGLVYVEGTDMGGVVDGWGANASGKVPVSTWTGRTWTGILAASVVMPGDGHYVMDGEANAAIAALVERQGLGGVFSAPTAPSGIDIDSYQVARFADVYSAIRGALASAGARLEVERRGGTTWLSAVPARTVRLTGRGSASYVLSQDTRPVNHLVCGGEGQGAERVVVHLYADEGGNVSRTQTLTGLDEVTEFYDYASADEAQLVESGTETLRQYQQAARQLALNELSAAGDVAVGDVAEFLVAATGQRMAAEVTGKVVSVAASAAPTVTYRTGVPAPATRKG